MLGSTGALGQRESLGSWGTWSLELRALWLVWRDCIVMVLYRFEGFDGSTVAIGAVKFRAVRSRFPEVV